MVRINFLNVLKNITFMETICKSEPEKAVALKYATALFSTSKNPDSLYTSAPSTLAAYHTFSPENTLHTYRHFSIPAEKATTVYPSCRRMQQSVSPNEYPRPRTNTVRTTPNAWLEIPPDRNFGGTAVCHCSYESESPLHQRHRQPHSQPRSGVR